MTHVIEIKRHSHSEGVLFEISRITRKLIIDRSIRYVTGLIYLENLPCFFLAIINFVSLKRAKKKKIAYIGV